MSQPNRLFTDGQALTTPDMQRVADLTAQAPDRATELLLTPGSVQKKIVPLLEESPTVNTGLLVVPGTTAGKVQIQPCALIAGVTPASGVSTSIQMAGTVTAAIQSAQIAANSSGSTRYDLLYATIQYAVTSSATRKTKNKTSGAVSNETLNIEQAVSVTLGVVANVNSSAPLSSLPADTAGSVYNFGLAMVIVANGYTLGTAITQSEIVQEWSRGWLQKQRTQGIVPMSLFIAGGGNAATSSLSSMTAGAERWGHVNSFFVYMKFKNTDVVVLDDTIDWRNRFYWGFWTYFGSASQLPLEGTAAIANGGVGQSSTVPLGLLQMQWTGTGGFGATILYGASKGFGLYVDPSSGYLKLEGTGSIDSSNGDLIGIAMYATDALTTGI